MRIISGKWGGRRLLSFRADHIRPTTDRVKESIFNRLQPYLPEARVLDLYAGTGNLSFEALSRGAAYVESVENHRKSIQIIQSNRRHLGLDGGAGGGGEGEQRVVCEDVMRFLRRYAGSGFDLILIDPPFTQSLADATMSALSESQVCKNGTIVVIESSGQEPIADQYGVLQLEARKIFGDKTVSFFVVEKPT